MKIIFICIIIPFIFCLEGLVNLMDLLGRLVVGLYIVDVLEVVHLMVHLVVVLCIEDGLVEVLCLVVVHLVLLVRQGRLRHFLVVGLQVHLVHLIHLVVVNFLAPLFKIYYP